MSSMAVDTNTKTSQVETELARFCADYKQNKHSGNDLVRIISKHNPLALLRKRVERTCGRHFCRLWKECDQTCQYAPSLEVTQPTKASWNEEIGKYSPLQLPQPSTPSNGITENGKDETNEEIGHDSGGFILCPKDNIVQSETQEKKRREALQGALAFMQRFSLQTQKSAKLDIDSLSKASLKRNTSSITDEPTTSFGGKLLRTSEENRASVEGGIEPVGIEEEKEEIRNISPSLVAKTIPFRAVPVVDMSQSMQTVAKQIGAACRNVGFFYIVNHGVAQETIDNQVSVTKSFFASPLSLKRELDNRKSRGGIRGYFALGQENLNTAKGEKLARYRGDQKEGFDIGYEATSNEESKSEGHSDGYSGFAMAGENLWPPETASAKLDFKKQSLAYYDAMVLLGNRLMKCFALALQLNEDHFEKCLSHPIATLRMLHYPPQNPNDTHNKLGCGAHTDYGCCTILLQDAVGGLQVRNSKMQWVHAPPVPGSFVVNIGDMMARWTNQVFASTVHRVINTKAPQADRYSIPFFLNPNYDTKIECLPTCNSEGNPPKFEPNTCQGILFDRYGETFDHIGKK